MPKARVTPNSRFTPLMAFAIAALIGCALGCRPSPELILLRGDALLLASDREALDQRLALVEAGRYADAHALWAARALLPPPSTSLDSGEMAWSRQIAAALEIYAVQGPKPLALDRLARAFDRARWFREARAVLEREQTLAALSADSQALLGVTTHLARLAAAADSAARSYYAAIERGESPSGGGFAVGELMARFGISLDALKARGLHLGQRHSPARPEVDELEFAVVVSHEGPFVIRQGDETVNARRIVLDDHFITPYPGGQASPWEPGSMAVVEEGTLFIYHDRSGLRRAATLLFIELERRGGRPPDVIPPAPAEAPAEAEARLALALHLRSVSALFAETRAAEGVRDEMVRRFVVDLISARMAQIEAGEAKRLIEERARPGTTGGVRGAEARLLGALRYGPLPGLRLADAIDDDRAPDPDDPASEAARETLNRLNRLVGAPHGEKDAKYGRAPPLLDVESLLRLDTERLRTLAAAIEAERFPVE